MKRKAVSPPTLEDTKETWKKRKKKNLENIFENTKKENQRKPEKKWREFVKIDGKVHLMEVYDFGMVKTTRKEKIIIKNELKRRKKIPKISPQKLEDTPRKKYLILTAARRKLKDKTVHLAQDNPARYTSPQRILTRKLKVKNEMKTTSTQHLNSNFASGPIEEKKTGKLINFWEDKNHIKTPPQIQASIRTKNARKLLCS